MAQVEQVGGREVRQVAVHVDRGAPAPRGRDVVARDQVTVDVDSGHQLFELQCEQAPVGAELDHLAGDLVGDSAHHLQSLRDHGDVAHGDQILDLERRKRIGHLVQTRLVPVSYTQLRAHETDSYLVCRLLLEKKKNKK